MLAVLALSEGRKRDGEDGMIKIRCKNRFSSIQ